MWAERAQGIRAEEWWPRVTPWTLAFMGANLVTLLGGSVWMIVEVTKGSEGVFYASHFMRSFYSTNSKYLNFHINFINCPVRAERPSNPSRID